MSGKAVPARPPAIGRNDPCPCGSGKKYKQCCLGRDQSIAAGRGADAASKPLAISGAIAGMLQTAVGLHQAGMLQEADALYRQILFQQPQHADALHLSGLIAHQSGRHQQALDLIDQAIAIRPSPVMHCNLGLALDAMGNKVAAIESFLKAIAMQPDYADAYINLGASYKDQRKLAEAVDCYRKALSLKPDSAEAWFNLGIALQADGKPQEALDSFRLGLNYRPGYAKGHALQAGIHIDLGQFELASVAIAKALEADPETPLAWILKAGVRKMTPADEDWLRKALGLIPKIQPPYSEDAIALRFAIGKYHDDTGHYDEAFSMVSEANKLRRSHGGGFDRKLFTRQIDAQIATYAAGFFQMQREGASLSERPLLIVGMPRSGTSLVEQIVSSHPAVFGAGELAYWGRQGNANSAAVFSGKYSRELLAGVAAGYVQLLKEHSTDAARVIDKMPGNFFWIGFILAAFPQARIIHTQRNPIDTCLSIYFQNFNSGHAYATDLDELAFYYREYQRLMSHWRSVLPAQRMLEVPYESLTEDQEKWSRRLIDFTGLEWDPRCLDFHKTERKVGTASNWQVRQAIYQTSKARWRNYEKHLGPLLSLLETNAQN